MQGSNGLIILRADRRPTHDHSHLDITGENGPYYYIAVPTLPTPSFNRRLWCQYQQYGNMGNKLIDSSVLTVDLHYKNSSFSHDPLAGFLAVEFSASKFSSNRIVEAHNPG